MLDIIEAQIQSPSKHAQIAPKLHCVIQPSSNCWSMTGVNQDALFYDQKYSFNEKIVLKLEKPSPLLKKRHKSMENADFC